MYKNFILTESEKEQILNMHKNNGYGKKLREGDDEKYFARHGEGNIAWTGSSNKTYGDLPDGDYDDETYDDFDSLHATHPEFHSHYTGSGNVELAKGMFDKYKRSQGPLLVKKRRIQNDQPLNEQESNPFKVGQTVKAIRDKDNKVYTIQIAQIGGSYVGGKITGPGKYQDQPLDGRVVYELTSNKAEQLSGNMDMGIFKITQ